MLRTELEEPDFKIFDYRTWMFLLLLRARLERVTIFFSIRFFFRRYWRFTGQHGKWGEYFYSSLSLPPAHEHSEMYLQLNMWVGYNVFFYSHRLYLPDCFWMRFTTLELSFDSLMREAFVCLRFNSRSFITVNWHMK